MQHVAIQQHTIWSSPISLFVTILPHLVSDKLTTVLKIRHKC